MLKKYSILCCVIICIQNGIFSQDSSRISDEPWQHVKVQIGTFLGNWQRNYYGNEAPARLNILWKHYLGKGITVISTTTGEKEWAGCGWTGQPLLIREGAQLFLIQGAFDHHLKKINAEDGSMIWQYKFDDVIKGTGTVWLNKNAADLSEYVIIMQGSRRGLEKNCDSDHVPSFRAVSYFSSKELWRLDVKKTRSYSRDVDASALVINDTVYIGLENAIFTIFNPDTRYTKYKDNMLQPEIVQEVHLYNNKDIMNRGGQNKTYVNLVVESSPCLLNNHIYITAGSGHVYGYNMKSKRIDWDFYIGSDMDGSPVVTSDSCLLVSIEKQYITGKGGLFKLDPKKPPSKAVIWYFPTENDSVETWEGGIIGSPCINDQTKPVEHPFLAACLAIDGYLYVLNHKEIDYQKGKVLGPDDKSLYATPKLVYKKLIGPSISTPIMVGNKLIAAGYNGIYLFSFDETLQFNLLDKLINIEFESTPIVHNGRMYIGSRDGYLYCFGE
jgi:outer membrane protein assembly factor BamB